MQIEQAVNNPSTCRHFHTQLVAKDADAEYRECLDCGAILDRSEMPEPGPEASPATKPEFHESLSDA